MLLNSWDIMKALTKYCLLLAVSSSIYSATVQYFCLCLLPFHSVLHFNLMPSAKELLRGWLFFFFFFYFGVCVSWQKYQAQGEMKKLHFDHLNSLQYYEL